MKDLNTVIEILSLCEPEIYEEFFHFYIFTIMYDEISYVKCINKGKLKNVKESYKNYHIYLQNRKR